MLDIKFIRANPEEVRRGLERKRAGVELDRVLRLDQEWRTVLASADELKRERNEVSEEIGARKRAGRDAAELMGRMKGVSAQVKELDTRLAELEEALQRLLLTLPNLPHASVPDGAGPEANQIVRTWGQVPSFDFTPRPHWDIMDGLGLTHFGHASRLSGAGFSLFRGDGALLVRALIQFMLDLQTKEHGYLEIWPPYLVTRECMVGTGQLPKLEEDMYRTDPDDLFLIPTAEVPLTNLHRGEVLDGDLLPLLYTAYTPCFRREAGAYGKETRGLNRVHQFDKVELVRVTRPERSYEELEILVGQAEEVLRRLEIPYRVSLLSSGDLGFAAAKCYDLEAWSPGQEKWLEVSSCSNFEDFQARRLEIRYRPAPGEKPRLVHTLNGSGVALPRTIIALVENHQTRDGRVRVPGALRPYLGGREFLA